MGREATLTEAAAGAAARFLAPGTDPSAPDAETLPSGPVSWHPPSASHGRTVGQSAFVLQWADVEEHATGLNSDVAATTRRLALF